HVNRKRLQRLMRLLGLAAIYQRPNTSKPAAAHKIYPYLLRGLAIDRVNQVWCSDITYIPMAKGFLYLVVIMDWVSRAVLAWRLSNTLDADFCVEALEEALSRYRQPEIFNTDQGSQFTSDDFTATLKRHGVTISMARGWNFTTRSASTRAWVIARRGKFTSKTCGYVDDRRCRPAALPPLPEQARNAGKCSPSPTSPQAPRPTIALILMKWTVDSANQSHQSQRSEPISKPAGLHLRNRLRLSHVRGPPQPSVAVLPFINMSGDPDQEFFADGIAEDIITALSRYPSLFVIARNSCFIYKGRAADVKQIGRELGVRYVIEGSLRKSGNRIRVTAQLVEAEAGKHVWAERYDRDVADIFALQDEITEAVTIAVAPAVAEAELQRAMRKPPGSLDAWAAYQRGLWHLSKFTAEDNAAAQKFFQKAIDLDPTFAGGFAGLARRNSTQPLDFRHIASPLCRVRPSHWRGAPSGSMAAMRRRVHASLPYCCGAAIMKAHWRKPSGHS